MFYLPVLSFLFVCFCFVFLHYTFAPLRRIYDKAFPNSRIVSVTFECLDFVDISIGLFVSVSAPPRAGSLSLHVCE